MTKPSDVFTIQKVRKGTNLPYWGLKNTQLLVSFPYIQTSDVLVWIYPSNTDHRHLVEGVENTLHNNLVQLNEQQLGLDIDDGLEVVLSVARNTQLPQISFQPGAAIRADALNGLFTAHQLKLEELDARQGSTFSSTPPPNPATGQLWVSSDSFRIFVWTGKQWVDVK